MKLTELQQRLSDVLNEEAFLSYEGEIINVSTNLETQDGMFDLFYDTKGECEVQVLHDNEHESPLLEKFLSENLRNCIDWEEVIQRAREESMDVYYRQLDIQDY